MPARHGHQQNFGLWLAPADLGDDGRFAGHDIRRGGAVIRVIGDPEHRAHDHPGAIAVELAVRRHKTLRVCAPSTPKLAALRGRQWASRSACPPTTRGSLRGQTRNRAAVRGPHRPGPAWNGGSGSLAGPGCRPTSTLHSKAPRGLRTLPRSGGLSR